jgi:hypothetical protein
MIHQGEGLPFGLEAGDDRARVHAELDDLDGDFAPERLQLRGAIDDPATALADVFQHLITGKVVLAGRGWRWFIVVGGREVALQTEAEQTTQAEMAGHIRGKRRAAV